MAPMSGCGVPIGPLIVWRQLIAPPILLLTRPETATPSIDGIFCRDTARNSLRILLTQLMPGIYPVRLTVAGFIGAPIASLTGEAHPGCPDDVGDYKPPSSHPHRLFSYTERTLQIQHAHHWRHFVCIVVSTLRYYAPRALLCFP